MLQISHTWQPASHVEHSHWWPISQIVASDLHTHACTSHPNRLGTLDQAGKTPRSERTMEHKCLKQASSAYCSGNNLHLDLVMLLVQLQLIEPQYGLSTFRVGIVNTNASTLTRAVVLLHMCLLANIIKGHTCPWISFRLNLETLLNFLLGFIHLMLIFLNILKGFRHWTPLNTQT